ncbi:L,D-transpeptidase family protein [Sphingosinicella sp. LHD-64]|uniref:L,D-transpeptidase family protein n=1 Tax=Sphingosinicella sp. LHD-64 TaxID=3072139 RepID=UPI00280F57B5|nr:L,D-transpeptidase family protein [Sphingosinicella sp. LHD-64]MDQ8757910.1 L,D-transpeptidase family protein [Sphingosinicella sp. LHD-64]
MFKLSALALLLASPTMPGAIQTAAFAQQAQPVPVQAPPPLSYQPVAPVPVIWQRAAAEELLSYVEAIGQEGLDPAAYEPQQLRAALATGDDASVGPAATEIFLRLTADLSGGAVRGDARGEWYMPDSSIDGNQQQQLLARAAGGGVAGILNALLPTHPQYAGLRRALAMAPEEDTARRELIRANMERWRWMPRSLGQRHLLVNVPAFTAAIVDDGRVTRRHRTVVGARRTQTPALSATVTAVTLNPWWTLPQSIIREMGGRFNSSYVVTRNGGMTIARQRPGPGNSLGRVKIEMPNEHAIYLHDTPAQNLFSRPVRAFSHGCIRTQYVRDFAAELLASTGQWDRAAIDAAIDAGRTQQVPLAQPIPVYIAYFTAAATTDGNIVTYADIYGRDAAVRRALNGGRTAVASAD